MTIALLGQARTGWLESLAGRCRRPARVLDLAAPSRGGEVLVDRDRVLWQGFDLADAEVIFVERCLFAWPQPGVDAEATTPDRGAEREARALALSALHAAAEIVPMLDPPRAADLAVAPVLALDRCAAAGLSVHPWVLQPERPAEDDGRVWLDPVGEDLWSRPIAPRSGEPAWSPEPFAGGVVSLLAVDGRALGGRRFADSRAWGAGRPTESLAADAVPTALCEGAVAAQRALQLSWLQVDLLEGDERGAILSVRAGVDPASWDEELDGAVAAALVELLEGTARDRR